MVPEILRNILQPVIRAETRFRRQRIFYTGFGIGALALVILALLAYFAHWWSLPLLLLVLIGSLAYVVVGLFFSGRRQLDVNQLARKIEHEHSDLNSALLTAMEMEPGPRGEFSYLQNQVLEQVKEHAVANRWVRRVSDSKIRRALWLQVVSVVAFVASLYFMIVSVPSLDLAQNPTDEISTTELKESNGDIDLIVSPGDIEIELGSRLVVEANFKGRSPRGAMLLLTDPESGSERRRLPMRAGLDDAVFSTVISRVDSDTDYQVLFEESHSPAYQISTYEHPVFQQATATITEPDYTGKQSVTLENTVKISVLEGSTVAWEISLNKPVLRGELVGQDGVAIALKTSPRDPKVLVVSHIPERTQTYRLHLIDKQSRSNKRPPLISIKVKRNLPPKMEFTFPQRDIQVSSLQEMVIESRMFDDVGLEAAGIEFNHNGKKKEITFADSPLPGNKYHPFKTLLAIESLEAKPREMISYHLWAEDLDRDGKARRTYSDMFLAEVRHFENIFRQQAGEGGVGQPNQSEQLVKVQKDILNASWKLLREAQLGKSTEDLSQSIQVIIESQLINIGKTDQVIAKVEDPEIIAFLESAKTFMVQAVEQLDRVVGPFGEIGQKDVTKPLDKTHSLVRSAYQELIKARSRERNITQRQVNSSEPNVLEQQLRNLELKQKSLDYKQNTKAADEQAANQGLEILNKLKELARRQEAIAEKIKELETQLEAAESEAERNEIERQLKRLQEDQNDLLEDLDDLSQKMDSDENRSEMAEQRGQIEEIRENVRETAEQLEQQQLADAANSATRAQRDLEQVEKQVRESISSQFAEQIKDLRKQARDLAENQQQISEILEQKGPDRSLAQFPYRIPKENLDLAKALDNQQRAFNQLLDQVRQLSEQSAESEPLLSDRLYEAVRESTTNGVEQALGEARDEVYDSRRRNARGPEQNAAEGIDNLRDKIEQAAEQILGSEAEALQLARSEIDRLIDQAKQEAGRGAKGEQKGQGKDSAKGGKGKEKGAKGQLAQGKGKGGAKGQKGKGQKGKEPGQGEKGDQPGGQGPGKGPSSSQPQRSLLAQGGGGGEGESSAPMFFDRGNPSSQSSRGPITGAEYKQFANSLGNLEEMMNQEELRNRVAGVLDNARDMRIKYKRDNLPPGAKEIRMEIIKPLVEIRSRVSEELAKLNRNNPLAPIDRDPVPAEFRELVRKYYQQLGSGN